MHIIDTRGDTIRYPHHKTILFTFPNAERTAVANKRSWNCNRVIIRATVLPREEQLVADEDLEVDEGGDEEYDEAEEEEDIDAGQGEPELEDTPAADVTIPPPQPPLYPPFTHEMGGSSASAAYMPLDPTFLQSFSNLQVEVSGLREGFTGISADPRHLFGRMDSIEEGVSYFRGFIDRQEEREKQRIQREEERAMREAREYKEHRRTNELL